MLKFSHEPPNYICNACLFLQGSAHTKNEPSDIVYQNEFATALISYTWWENVPSHVVVMPNKHFENIYSIPDEYLSEIYKAVKKVATAMRNTYDCDGTSTGQHNEPAGGQELWHFHAHVYPRRNGDNFFDHPGQKSFIDAKERARYAVKLREYFATYDDQQSMI